MRDAGLEQTDADWMSSQQPELSESQGLQEISGHHDAQGATL